MGTLYRNGIPYVGSGGAGGVEVTQAEYDALPTSEKMNGSIYFITDGSVSYPTASQMRYDNTESGIPSTSVQGAIDELKIEIGDTDISSIGDGTLSGAVSELNNGLTDIFPNNGTYETIGSANSTFTVERTGLYLVYATSASSSNIMQLALYDNTAIRNVAVLFASNGAGCAQLCYLEIGHTYRVLTRTNVGSAYLYS